MDITDFHTHHPSPKGILSLRPEEFRPVAGQLYSVGIHPWDSEDMHTPDYSLLDSIVKHPAVIMIGETGIDILKGANVELQKEIFIHHINLSESLRKPLVIHAVRSHDTIIPIRKRINPDMPWIIHGFRGNEHIAKIYLDAGFYLSFGEHFNEKAVQYTPADKILTETDDSTASIESITSQIALIKGITPHQLHQNINTLLNLYL